MGRHISLTRSAGLIKTTSTSIVAERNDRLLCNVTNGPINVTLPPPGVLSDGDTVRIFDVNGLSGTNNINVLRNGANIQNLAQDLTININNACVTLEYYTVVGSWLIVTK